MSNHEEYKTHIAIVKHHYTAFPHVKLMYVPNAVRSASDAFFNKMMGAVPGAHDLMLFWGRPMGVGIFEVKSRTGRLSSQQNKFASAMHTLGAYTGYGSSVKSYHETLKSWGLVPHHNAVTEPDYRTQQQKYADVHAMYMPLPKGEN